MKKLLKITRDVLPVSTIKVLGASRVLVSMNFLPGLVLKIMSYVVSTVMQAKNTSVDTTGCYFIVSVSLKAIMCFGFFF